MSEPGGMRSSLNKSLAAIWLFVVVAAVALGVLMNGLVKLGVEGRVDAVAARVAQASALLRTRFVVYDKSFDTPPDITDAQRRRELSLIVQLVLQDFEDVEGGFFADGDFLAYAYPSYQGSGTKRDVPEAEALQIARLAQDAIDAGARKVSRSAGERQVLILEAEPLRNGDQKLALWVMSRAHVRADDASRHLLIGLGVLSLFVIGSGSFFALLLRRWNRGLTVLNQQLERTRSDQPMQLATTGHRDLDRVARMVSSLHDRLRAERLSSAALESELARARRVASLGRMTAQLVHEVRNPIAAMQLRAENALAGAGECDAALRHILKDVHRLDDLLERMQAMTRLNTLHIEPVELSTWLERGLSSVRERALRRGVDLRGTAPEATWPLDPVQMARALDNLLLNGIAHARDLGGTVAVTIETVEGRTCRIAVRDNGAGIPEQNKDQVFDAFFTTRLDGTGLGLSITREIVEAHGGTLTVEASSSDRSSTGACFVIEIPWRAS